MIKLLKYLTASALILFASTSSAAIIGGPNVLTANDGNVNFFNVFDPTYKLYLFDDGLAVESGWSTSLGLEIGSTPTNTDVVGMVSNGFGDYNAINSNGESILLTGSPSFYLGVYDGVDWYANNFIVAAGGNAYTVVWDIAGYTFAVDVQAIPVPAAVWLFGSGLLGLVVVARRRLSS